MTSHYPAALLVLVLAVLVWSGIGPYDTLTWFLEVFPVLVAIPLLLATHRRFPLTTLVYTAIAVHAVILMVGGHYTYARVPFGFWLAEIGDFGRNHYDRIGHIAQGFVPALVAREILLRQRIVAGGWLWLFVTSFCLAFSAFYELVEWWAALVNDEAAQAFLGTQGDVWDTQWDMFLALLGAVTAQLLLGRYHDRALAPYLNNRLN